VDGDQVIVESSIIIEHLDLLQDSARASLVPPDAAEALNVRMLDRIFDHYVMDPVALIVRNRLRPPERRDQQTREEAHALLDKSLGWLDRTVSAPWAAAGEFSMADCAAAPALHYADKVHPLRARHPRLGAYLARLEERPSFVRVLAEAQPFAHMFPQDEE
jgi:glutathione S-transferase